MPVRQGRSPLRGGTIPLHPPQVDDEDVRLVKDDGYLFKKALADVGCSDVSVGG
jgi:hypothetical protein